MSGTTEPAGIVPRAEPDDRGLATAMRKADERAEAEAASEARLEVATRALFIDALYRAKALNGDAAFDVDDVQDLDAIEGMSARIAARRRGRKDGRA